MATEKYRFFDSVGDDRIYQADQFAEYFRMFLGDGIRNGGTCLKVTATNNGMQVKVDYGMAMIQGYAYWLEKDNKGPYYIDIPAANRQMRYDRVVLRLDRSMNQRHIKLFVKQGDTSGSWSNPPSLTRTENIWELSLAKIRVRANALQISQEDVTDERLNTATCGIINSLITLDSDDFDRRATAILEQLSGQGYLPLTGTAKDSERLGGRLPSAYATAEQGRKADQALPRSGGTMTGNINMGGYRLFNLGTPLSDIYVVNKGYVDSSIKAIDVYSTAADGAGAHNSIFRGKNLGSSVTSEQWKNIKNGTFKDLFIGDYWIYNGKRWRIAAFDYYYNKGQTKCTDHHVVIVPDALPEYSYGKPMNSLGTTSGGYLGSDMVSFRLKDVRTRDPYNIFGSEHLMGFSTFLVNATSNGRPSGGVWDTFNINLLSEIMVYGTRILGASNYNGNPAVTHTVETTQLPLFALAPEFITITQNYRESYWLRDIVTSTCFAIVDDTGRASYALANNDRVCIRPYICIYQA